MTDFQEISKRNLEGYRLQTDPLADAVVEAYFPGHRAELQLHLAQLENNSSQLSNGAFSELEVLWNDIHNKHTAIPKEVLKRGQAFFDQHASDIMLLLGLLSLPYCYAAANGAEVLIRSKRILEEPEKRLLETAEFVFDVASKDAFEKEGNALASILKVRLMHSAVRWYAKNSTEWNTNELGEPVNQEDMAGTNLAFSLIVARGLKKLGKKISSEEVLVYINYWNQIGKLLGVAEELLPETNKEAYVLERNIRERQFRPSDSGHKLTKSLLRYFEKATVQSPIKGKSNSFVAYLLGEDVANILGIKNSSFETASFRPYRVFYQIQNYLSFKNDSYTQALKQFKAVSKIS